MRSMKKHFVRSRYVLLTQRYAARQTADIGCLLLLQDPLPDAFDDRGSSQLCATSIPFNYDLKLSS
jgi:hypothetical protein